MVIVKNSDLLSVKFETLLADYDRETLSNLYQPLIGFEALSVFFTLWGEGSNQKVISITTHEDILNRMQMDIATFIDARKKLEAVGLIITKREKGNDVSVYHYHIYAPKTPYEFFDDTLLYGLLIKAVGEVNASRLKSIYHISKDNNEGEDITSTFGEVFHPDYNDEVFSKIANSSSSSMGRRKKKMALEFSYETFLKELSNISQINETAFSKEDMKELSRLTSLYGIDENTAATVVSVVYDPSKEKGKRLDFDKINKSFQDETNFKFLTKKKKSEQTLMNGDSDLASKVNMMEKTSPKDYLTIIANGTKPCIADLKIVDTLSRDYHLGNGVINVVIDFVLAMNDNVLSKAYAEKIAASLARSNIESAIDAMNYLTSQHNKKKNNKVEYSKGGNKVETKKEEKQSSQVEEKDDDWDDIFSALENN